MGNTFGRKRKKKDIPMSLEPEPEPDFRYINGRRYHNVKDSKYPLPNDDDELDRLHLQHFVVRHVFQSNFSAPVEHVLESDSSNVLDVGCGAGSWMFDMATDYPRAKITGIDISPVQPSNIRPINVTFVYANLLDGLPFEDNTFDYVFQRFMLGAITYDNWPAIIKELTRVLKPGGYLELSEMSLPYRMGPVSTQLYDALDEFFIRQSLDSKIIYRLRSLVEQNDQLEDVDEDRDIVPYGAEFGRLAQAGVDNLKAVFEHMKPCTQPILGVTSEEYDEMSKTLLKELKEYNSYADIIRIYARKKENI